MSSRRQIAAARRNIRRAAKAAKREHTLQHLPARVRTAPGKQGAKARRRAR
jgi:hypothetical protein